jgi:hypothetical protein
MNASAGPRTDAILAGLLALLWAAPAGILVAGGGALPAPGSLNDPVRALPAIAASPALTVVAALILATGAVQVFVVIAVDARLAGRSRRRRQLAVAFGVVSGSFLMLDGALGVTALPQLAHLNAGQAAVDGAYLATLGMRNGIDRVIPLTLGLWALTSHWPAGRGEDLPRPLTILGMLLGAAGVAGAALPAAGTASVLLAILWAGAFALLALSQATAGPARRATPSLRGWRRRARRSGG